MSKIFERVGFAILQDRWLKAFEEGKLLKTFQVEKCKISFSASILTYKKNKRLVLLYILELFKTVRGGNTIDFDLIGFNAISLSCTSR